MDNEDIIRQLAALEMTAQATLLNVRVLQRGILFALKAGPGAAETATGTGLIGAKEPKPGQGGTPGAAGEPDAPKAALKPVAEEVCSVGCRPNYRMPSNNKQFPQRTKCRMCGKEHE